jgi:hypothetical protein
VGAAIERRNYNTYDPGACVRVREMMRGDDRRAKNSKYRVEVVKESREAGLNK